MARHKQSERSAKLKGLDKQNPGRYKGTVPEHKDALGSAPEYMSEEAVVCWNELASKCLPGVMTHADSNVLELAANLLAEYRRDVVAFQIGKYTHLIGCLARLGMSPADRQKLAIENPQTENPYLHKNLRSVT